jgi:pilus assembly protein Flp/PilA
MRNLSKKKKGQGMTEYILIIALIAIVVIGAVRLFGGKVKDGFRETGNKIGTDIDSSLSNSDSAE